jgi:2-hydroxy-3-oxopropionate reductase
MGAPMTLNLLKATFPVAVYARREKTAEPLIKHGAVFYSSPKELAAHVDVVITMVTATSDVEEMLLGKQGVIHGAKQGSIVIDMSTIGIASTKKIAEQLAKKQIEMLDAPVSGGEQGAIAGTLSIMVGGKKEVLKKVRSILNVLGKKIVHIGDHGAGQIAKACNQVIIAETIIAVSEALRLAKASGVDPTKVREALLEGFAGSRVLEVHGKRMLENNYQPGFKSGLHRKDVHLALDQAHQLNIDLPAAKYAMQCLDRLVMKGHQEMDSSALHLLAED